MNNFLIRFNSSLIGFLRLLLNKQIGYLYFKEDLVVTSQYFGISYIDRCADVPCIPK